MKTRWILLAGLLFLAGLVCVLSPFRLILLGWLCGEPCYRGMPVSYWRYPLRDWCIDHSRRPETVEDRLRDKRENPARLANIGGFMINSSVIPFRSKWDPL